MNQRKSRIRKFRLKNGWTQEKLGEMMKMSQPQISKIETGGCDSVQKLKELAKVFEVTVQELIDD